MSMTAEDILKLPPEQQSDAIDQAAEHLSMDDIQMLSEAMIRKVDQNLKACTGFANSQKAVQDRKNSQIAATASRKAETVDAEGASDFASVAQRLSGSKADRAQEAEARDTHPEPEAIASVDQDEVENPFEASTEPEAEEETAPMLLTPEQKVVEEDHVEIDVEDDPAARHGFPEIVDPHLENQRDTLVNSMLAASRSNASDVSEEQSAEKPKSFFKRMVEGVGTLQFRLMPLLWGTAGGWLIAQVLTSRFGVFNATLAGIMATMFITLTVGRMTRQKALISTLLAGAGQCAIGLYTMGVPNTLEFTSIQHVVVAGIGGFYLLIAGGVGIRRFFRSLSVLSRQPGRA